MVSLAALFGPKPPELGRDWLLGPTSQARYANIAVTSYLIASQSLFSLSGLMVLFSCLSAKGLGGDREALTIWPAYLDTLLQKICLILLGRSDHWGNMNNRAPEGSLSFPALHRESLRKPSGIPRSSKKGGIQGFLKVSLGFLRNPEGFLQVSLMISDEDPFPIIHFWGP